MTYPSMKKAIKSSIHILFTILLSPLIIIHFASKVMISDGIFVFSSQLLSLIPGKTGSYCRIAFYRYSMSKCNSECFIGFNTIFSQTNTNIEKGVYIGPQCNIGMCSIGQDSLIASGVHIMSGNQQHRFDDIDTPIQQQGGTLEKISIGEDCWVGNGSLIMANIGKKCIIGAGSVVTTNIPDYAIAVGNPARVVRLRSTQEN